jgi:hypothetical protein
MELESSQILTSCKHLQDALTAQRPDLQWSVLPRSNGFNHWLAEINVIGTVPRRIILRERGFLDPNVDDVAARVIVRLKV